MDRKIGSIVALSLLSRIIYLCLDKNIWWDAAVYISMGKYMATMGHLGLWEPIRPLLWPIILGYGYAIGLDPIIWGHIFSTIFSLACIYLTYLIAKKLFNERTALLSSLLLSFTWVFFFFNARLYTEIPALCFALCAYYCFLKNKPLETGICTALAFLTKFPEGIILIIFALFWIKSLKKLFFLGIGFMFLVIPYLAYNYFLYGSPIEILLFAQEFLKYAGIWIFQQPWWWYPVALVKENVLLLFVIPGILFSAYKKKYSLIALSLISLIYFSQMPHKEIRFVILFLPFLCILAAYGYQKIFKEYESFIIIVLLLFILHFSIEEQNTNSYFTFFEGKDIEGEILVTHPLSSVYTEKEVTMMYYPWFNSSQAEYWLKYIKDKNPEYISLDTCEGGFICPPDENPCKETQEEIINYLNENYTLEFEKRTPTCEYFIYRSTNVTSMK